jgi:hypothetical protein
MFVIERLRLDHAATVLVFEQENRAYFAASVSDRGEQPDCVISTWWSASTVRCWAG